MIYLKITIDGKTTLAIRPNEDSLPENLQNTNAEIISEQEYNKLREETRRKVAEEKLLIKQLQKQDEVIVADDEINL